MTTNIEIIEYNTTWSAQFFAERDILKIPLSPWLVEVIEPVDNALVLHPVDQDTLAYIEEILTMFSSSFMTEDRNNDDSEEVARRNAGRRLVDNLKNSEATNAAKELTFDDVSLLIDDSINEVKV